MFLIRTRLVAVVFAASAICFALFGSGHVRAQETTPDQSNDNDLKRGLPFGQTRQIGADPYIFETVNNQRVFYVDTKSKDEAKVIFVPLPRDNVASIDNDFFSFREGRNSSAKSAIECRFDRVVLSNDTQTWFALRDSRRPSNFALRIANFETRVGYRYNVLNDGPSPATAVSFFLFASYESFTFVSVAFSPTRCSIFQTRLNDLMQNPRQFDLVRFVREAIVNDEFCRNAPRCSFLRLKLLSPAGNAVVDIPIQ